MTTKLSELTGEYVLDPTRTRIGFVVRQALVTKVRGRYDEFEGYAQLDGDDPSRSSVQPLSCSSSTVLTCAPEARATSCRDW